MKFTTAARRGLVALTLAGVLAGAVTELACAAPSDGEAAGAASPKASSSLGWRITNDSSAILVVKNSSAELPIPAPAGTSWLPGQTLDFELATAYSDTSGSVAFEVFNADGHDLGPASLVVSSRSRAGTFWFTGQQMTGGGTDRFVTNHDGAKVLANQTNELLDQAGTDCILDADTYGTGPNGLELGSLVQGVMQGAGRNHSSYDVDTVTSDLTKPELVAATFDDTEVEDPAPVTGSDGELSYKTEWEATQTNSYDISEKVGIDLFDVVEAGITLTEGHEYSTSETYGVEDTVPLRPQTTASIWETATARTAHGTLNATLGNTTWTFQHSDFSFPKPAGITTAITKHDDGNVDPIPPSVAAVRAAVAKQKAATAVKHQHR